MTETLTQVAAGVYVRSMLTRELEAVERQIGALLAGLLAGETTARKGSE